MFLIKSCVSPFLKVSIKEVEISKRKFDCPNAEMRAHLEKIGKSFLKGYHKALGCNENDFGSDNSAYIGFVYEGEAMGSALIDIIAYKKERHINSLLKKHPEHIYMLHVGIGWALARIPFINIENKLNRFDSILRGLILDGYGFHQAYFKTKKYVYDMILPHKLKQSNSIHIFYQGIGRALWFVYGGQPKKISSKIEEFDELYRNDLWSGLGLAIAYAGGVPKTDLLELKRLGANYESELAQGVAFACKARQLAGNMETHTELAAQIFCKISADNAAYLTDVEKKNLTIELNSKSLYSEWRKNIINNFKKQFYREKILVEE